MGNSILYFSCPNKTSVSWWCFKVSGRLTAQLPPILIQYNRPFSSSTESGSEPYVQVVGCINSGFLHITRRQLGRNDVPMKHRLWEETILILDIIPASLRMLTEENKEGYCPVHLCHFVQGTTHSFIKNSNFIPIFRK